MAKRLQMTAEASEGTTVERKNSRDVQDNEDASSQSPLQLPQ